MADQNRCPDSQLVADLKTRVRNSNRTITTLAKQVEALEARVLKLREAADRLADWVERWQEGTGMRATAPPASLAADYRAVRDETGNKTSDEMIRSGPGAGGRRSYRTYTRAEVAAARRLKLAHGREKHDQLEGPIYWATGSHYPRAVKRLAADAALVLAAIEREWPKEGEK